MKKAKCFALLLVCTLSLSACGMNFSYRNPVTGEPLEKTKEEITNESEAKTETESEDSEISEITSEEIAETLEDIEEDKPIYYQQKYCIDGIEFELYKTDVATLVNEILATGRWTQMQENSPIFEHTESLDVLQLHMNGETLSGFYYGFNSMYTGTRVSIQLPNGITEQSTFTDMTDAWGEVNEIKKRPTDTYVAWCINPVAFCRATIDETGEGAGSLGAFVVMNMSGADSDVQNYLYNQYITDFFSKN